MQRKIILVLTVSLLLLLNMAGCQFNHDLDNIQEKSHEQQQKNTDNTRGYYSGDPYYPVAKYVSGYWTVKTGPGNQWVNLGSINNEGVDVLGKWENYYFIEYYITGSGYKKRGYIPQSAISGSVNIDYLPWYTLNNKSNIGARTYVYSHPSLSYQGVNIGWVANENIWILYTYPYPNRVAYIQYMTPSGWKSGYIAEPSGGLPIGP